MSISIFALPKYKSFSLATDEIYLNGKTSCSCKDGELENCWNFVVRDYYEQEMFRVGNEAVENFFELNGLFGKGTTNV